MSAASLTARVENFPSEKPAQARPPVAVGAGPVGIRPAQELERQQPGRRILLVGGEPRKPCDRVELDSLFCLTSPTRSLHRHCANLTFAFGRIASYPGKGARSTNDGWRKRG